MARGKRRDPARRAASVTPRGVSRPPQDIIDLTLTDSWAERSTARAVKPTPLSPGFNGRASTVAIPQDPKSSPAYVFQQLALARNRASIRPSFSSKVPQEDTDEQPEADEPDETPTPGEKEVKAKRKRKSKEKKDKQAPEVAEDEEQLDEVEGNKTADEGRVKKKKSKKAKDKSKEDGATPVEGKKKSKEIKREPEETEPGMSNMELDSRHLPLGRCILIKYNSDPIP